ncbi:MAG TPA: tetratricopeptide repeat protein [Saprospiraceae bacterium]|nr:tetratricopeptide repeat protein [Saprospiraceae bacterium]
MYKTFPVILFFFFAILHGITGQKNSNAERYLQMAEEFKKSVLPDSALVYYKKAAADFKENKKTEQLIDAYNQIGRMLTRQDKYEEARMYLGMAEIQGNTLRDTNDLLRAATFISLGVVYSSMGDFGGAIEYHHRSLAIRLLKSGKFDADVATSYGNIGNVYLMQKEYDKSIEAHLTALEIRKKVFGEKSVEINQSLNNLGKAYKEKKEYNTAIEYYQQLAQNKIEQLGPAHKDLVKIYNTLSELYFMQGNTDLGEFNKKKAEEILDTKE